MTWVGGGAPGRFGRVPRRLPLTQSIFALRPVRRLQGVPHRRHGLFVTHKDALNHDLLAFLKNG
ncbi:hypothetical protein ACFYOK_18395 [Microbispora bryophytorum]|uniref:hypothetical protein n=1 Tax=Microbispora bryophytorum TaxID=1460882 RepID=UPI0036A9630E